MPGHHVHSDTCDSATNSQSLFSIDIVERNSASLERSQSKAQPQFPCHMDRARTRGNVTVPSTGRSFITQAINLSTRLLLGNRRVRCQAAQYFLLIPTPLNNCDSIDLFSASITACYRQHERSQASEVGDAPVSAAPPTSR